MTGHHDVMEHKTSKDASPCQINVDQNILKKMFCELRKQAEFDCNVEK